MNKLMVRSYSCEYENCKCCFELERQTTAILHTNHSIPERSNTEEKNLIVQCKDQETKEKWITTITKEIAELKRLADYFSFPKI